MAAPDENIRFILRPKTNTQRKDAKDRKARKATEGHFPAIALTVVNHIDLLSAAQ